MYKVSKLYTWISRWGIDEEEEESEENDDDIITKSPICTNHLMFL